MCKTAKARLAKALIGNVQPSEHKSCSRWWRTYSKRMAKRVRKVCASTLWTQLMAINRMMVWKISDLVTMY